MADEAPQTNGITEITAGKKEEGSKWSVESGMS